MFWNNLALVPPLHGCWQETISSQAVPNALVAIMSTFNILVCLCTLQWACKTRCTNRRSCKGSFHLPAEMLLSTPDLWGEPNGADRCALACLVFCRQRLLTLQPCLVPMLLRSHACQHGSCLVSRSLLSCFFCSLFCCLSCSRRTQSCVFVCSCTRQMPLSTLTRDRQAISGFKGYARQHGSCLVTCSLLSSLFCSLLAADTATAILLSASA